MAADLEETAVHQRDSQGDEESSSRGSSYVFLRPGERRSDYPILSGRDLVVRSQRPQRQNDSEDISAFQSSASRTATTADETVVSSSTVED